MTKKAAAFLAFVSLFLSGLAFANTAVVTSVTGTVQAQTGTAPARNVNVGDVLRQGDTVSTSAASTVVFKFEDGQVTALTANSRMAITTYQYDAKSQKGNVVLSLIDGGMRAITGLIGRSTPQNVAFRAATATIGIRGTEITIATSRGDVVVTVAAGQATFTLGGRTVTINTGQGIVSRGNLVSAVVSSSTQALQEALATTGATSPEARAAQNALVAFVQAANDPSILAAIRAANPGTPSSGGQTGSQGNNEPSAGSGGPATGGSSSGGGGASGG